MEIKTNNPPKNHINITNLSEFKESFAFYFGKGSAAERSFSNSEHFNQVLEATKDLKQKV